MDCKWSTYYINHPLLNIDIWPKGEKDPDTGHYESEWMGRYWDEGCNYDKNPIPAYDA